MIFDTTLQIELVPLFGVTDVIEGKIELARPEERHGVEALASAEYVPRRRLSLALGHDPVLDANIVPGQRVGPARDVAGGEDTRNAGFEMFVHRHATIRLDSGAFGEFDERLDADPDHNQVGANCVAVLERHFAFVDRYNALLEMEHTPLRSCRRCRYAPTCGPRTLSIGTASGATTWTLSFR